MMQDISQFKNGGTVVNCGDLICVTVQGYIFCKFVCWHVSGKFQYCSYKLG